MDSPLHTLYARLKAREITPEQAAEQFTVWKTQQPASERLASPLREATTPSTFQVGSALLETVCADLLQAAAHVLKVGAQDIDGDVKLHDYGFDQVKLVELLNHLSEAYHLPLPSDLLRQYPTLHGVASYMVDAYAEVLCEHYRAPRKQEGPAPVTDDTELPFAQPGFELDPLHDRAIEYFKQVLSTALKIPLQSVDANTPLEQYGINSVLIVELTGELEKVFGSLPKTLFFEHQRLSELTAYFLAYHGEKLKALLPIQTTAATSAIPEAMPTPAAAFSRPQGPTHTPAPCQHQPVAPTPLPPGHRREAFDVAIIGLSGRYPGADNLAQFWENLKAGRHSISEIPKDRWDWRDYFDDEKGKLGSIYTKWGGFLSAIDTFDPLFFRISPAEALSMDPQERLFIEETYAAIEDAGYTSATLGENRAMAGRSGRRIGVFVGVMNNTYGGNTRYWSIANRVSYLFDLQGPSMAVDTACSSSLTAIHLALESLYSGSCDCAIAGGVNVIVDPIHYQGLSAMTMLSPTDQCKAFGAQADGFVDGEGVGVLLLKPLARAIADHDHIYGVIKGSALNAGGKTNGYTVPNPKAQARVIAEALQQAGVDPRAVSYVEAHGTGTPLGDPIEISGLTQAFAQAARAAHSNDRQFCRIGSVKSNIGHLESAAGIAGVTKVLLQLQHRQLVPSLHASVLNPGIDFEASPFLVQQELAAWPRPRLEIEGTVKELPRIAGISSFGAGGANAHLILEEYIAEPATEDQATRLSDPTVAGHSGTLGPLLIVLSAKQDDQLKERARRLLAMLREEGRAWSDRDLADIAYTLQVGREAMEERLALMADSVEDLAQKLASFLAGHESIPDLFRGRATGLPLESMAPDLARFPSDEEKQRAFGAWLANGAYDQLLSLWVRGFTIDWEALLDQRVAYDQLWEGRPRRISLPTYPFAKERYWAPRVPRVADSKASNAAVSPATLSTSHHSTSAGLRAHFSSVASSPGFTSADPGVHEGAPCPVSAVSGDVWREKTVAYLTHTMASIIGIPAHRMEVATPLGEYGMDSVMAMHIIAQLEKSFGPLSKTLLFEYQDIQALSDFFLSAHRDRLHDVLGFKPETVPLVGAADAAGAPPAPAVNRERQRVEALPSPLVQNSADIAVIGLAGRYPQADTLDEFWENLCTGRDCVTEVPAERWDHGHYFDPDRSKPGKAYSKWGGFLDAVDRFDPLFFNISPRDAELMDPQERLFLECVWHLLENAGYARELLQARYQSKVGVYVGAMSQQYHAFDADLIRESAVALSSYYSIANRVSCAFDFQGPSMAIDTACSSALVAVHMACESLLKGECQLAIAGGVNVSIHPKKYIALSLAQIIASHADSRSFADGDGYIPAEGVGAVLLKPLGQAIRDGDSIFAIIKSSAVNHSGRSHGYAVPNPSAQAQLIIDNFRKSGINPRTISYVESAANGSALGDPIEVKALTRAFREFTGDDGFCAIGSVKSNIGHAEAASGMSQLAKVILQLQHGLLVPSIKAEPLNPNLSFDGTPFYLQRELREWRRPMIVGIGECPRRATVSSIGAGGTNAHLIIEEYVGEALPQHSLDNRLPPSQFAADAPREDMNTGQLAWVDSPQVVVLSARNWQGLRSVARRLAAYVQQHPACALTDLAYTLQTGREAMITRLAMVVGSRDELLSGLEEFLRVADEHPPAKGGALATSVAMFIGDLEGDGAEIRSLLTGKAGEAIVQVFLAELNLGKLALHWSQGGTIPWDALHAGKAVHKVLLPNYPFARQRYWITSDVPPGDGAAPSHRPTIGTSEAPPPDRLPHGEVTGTPQLVTPESFSALSRHDQLTLVLTTVLSEELGIPLDEIKPNKSFQDYGTDSLALLKMARAVEETFGAKVSGREMLEYPTIASLSRHLADTLAHETEPQARQPSSATYPLSKVQEGLWLLQKFSPHMSAYNVPVAIRFQEDLDVDRFRQACAFLLDEYPILGSRFTEVDGQPRQYIPAQRSLAFTHEVIDHPDESDIVPRLRSQVKQPFDLEHGPLLRVHLFSRRYGAKQEYIGLVTIHHIVFDGSSSLLLARTLVRAYHALSRGEELEAGAHDASYQDFVRWEQGMLAGPEGREHLAWWRQHLAGELPVLALRPDHPRPAVRGFSGSTLEATLDPALSAQLKALARSQRVSLSTLLLSLYKVLLHRYTGQEDLIVGMPTMGRPKNAFDQVMGCFINIMPVRSQVAGDQSFVDYLKTLQLTMIDSLDHAVYPFSELVRELNVDRDQSISPLFQTYYAYQNYVVPTSADLQHAEHKEALHTEILRGIHQEGDKDLGLEVYEMPDHFVLNIKYNPDLYEASTIERLLEHFTHLAAAVVEQPYGSIAGYDVFPAAQKMEMLHDWNDTARVPPEAQLLFQLFEDQATKTPDCTAVVFKEQTLTYAELDRRSRALAAYLQQQGAGPESFVGLYLGRSMEIVVGAVGILKSGGVYVPLDPALPEERLIFMMEDARVAYLLTTESLASRAQAFKSRIPTLKLIYLDHDWPAINRCGTFYSPPALQPENLAYVIYTSGSTGRPKGVMIAHLTTTRHCFSIRDDFHMAPGERVCLQSPMSFDASIEQIFAPLSIGATVAIRDLEVLSPKPFSVMLADLKVNIIQLPPAFILALFREWQLNPRLIPTDLKLLVSCGDVLTVETVRLWQAMLSERVTLLNVYGPTEVTAKATLYQLDPDLDTGTIARIPIGRPLANKKIYLLDQYVSPAPIGVPGELHIGGTGPGRGYHGRPALTAEKFRPDPFSARPGARLYNSGDLAYYRHDGTIEFLGRLDHQVKVRGHRIELGEIEAVLVEHPDIRSAAVITVDRGEDRRIVAYVVGKDGQALDQGDLKAFVGRQVPDSMVPSTFVCLEQMPLTPTGKINRRGLPMPDGAADEGVVAPRDAVELELSRIWQEVLAVQQVDIRQDFFALGGHSLLAIRLMVLIEQRMGRELPLATLFQAPTIEQLADILRTAGESPEPTIVTLQPLGVQRPLFCVPGAGGTVLYLNELAKQLGQDQPFHAFQAEGVDGRSEPSTSVPQLADQYVRAMRTLQPNGPYVLAGHSFGGRVAFEMTRVLERLGQQVQQLVLLDCHAPHPEEQEHDWDEATLLIAFAGALGLDIGGDIDLLSSLVADHELDHTLERILHALKQRHLVLPDTQITRVKGLFQVFYVNTRMKYVPEGLINAPITLFKGKDFPPVAIDTERFRQMIDDPAVLASIESMTRTWAQFHGRLSRVREDAYLGWKRYTTAAITVYDVPGDHMSLIKAPHVQSLARLIQTCVTR